MGKWHDHSTAKLIPRDYEPRPTPLCLLAISLRYKWLHTLSIIIITCMCSAGYIAPEGGCYYYLEFYVWVALGSFLVIPSGMFYCLLF
jgi:hypothetical protein